MLTCSYGAKHMPNKPLYIIMWSDKWPNTLTSVRKLANVVGNWPVAIGWWPTVILNSAIVIQQHYFLNQAFLLAGYGCIPEAVHKRYIYVVTKVHNKYIMDFCTIL